MQVAPAVRVAPQVVEAMVKLALTRAEAMFRSVPPLLVSRRV